MKKLKKWLKEFAFGKSIESNNKKQAPILDPKENELNAKTLFPGVYWFFIKIERKDNTIDTKLYEKIYNDILNVKTQKEISRILKNKLPDDYTTRTAILNAISKRKDHATNIENILSEISKPCPHCYGMGYKNEQEYRPGAFPLFFTTRILNVVKKCIFCNGSGKIKEIHINNDGYDVFDEMIKNADNLIEKQNSQYGGVIERCESCDGHKNKSFILPKYKGYNTCSYCGKQIIK